MKSVPLNAFPRTLNRRGGSKKLRAAGRIPAVIYADPAYDITEQVIAEVNKDRPPAPAPAATPAATTPAPATPAPAATKP